MKSPIILFDTTMKNEELTALTQKCYWYLSSIEFLVVRSQS